MIKLTRSRVGLVIAIAGFALAVTMIASTVNAQQTGYDQSLFKGLRYRLIGPFHGGRVLAVTGVPGNPNVYYFGSVAGGVWKTTDGGLNWHPLFDDQPVSSIGSIAVAPSDPNIIYVGTGEACIRGDISHGDGVYKSLDAGKTWKNIGLRDTQTIGRVLVHPKDANLVYVAALGHVYGQNEERGVFRTTDGGKNWEKVLYLDNKTGAIDIDFSPANPNIIFASLWEAYRTPYSLSSGGPGSGIYRSGDGGATWKRLSGSGLPKGIMGRIALSVAGGNPDRVYALIEAADGGLYRSDDSGTTWRLMSNSSDLTQRPWYFCHVRADPKNPDVVYVPGFQIYKSIDGGRTFTVIPQHHGDNHGFWIDPENPQRIINGNDGGANVTTNGGHTWTLSDLPITQMYHVSADNRVPYHVYGAKQDLGTTGLPSDSLGRGIAQGDTYDVGGGESGYVVPHPKDPNIVYAGSYQGIITRYDHRTNQVQPISPWPDHGMGSGAGDLKYRFQWTAPIATSPHNPEVIYHAGNVLFKSVNGGNSWTIISPDLTRNDKSKLGPSGGPLSHDNTSVEYYCTIFAVAESSKQKDLIWAGTDDGLIHITKDAGKTWTNITPKELPEWSLISQIDPSPHDPATAYVAVDRHELDDLQPYAYKTNDYGQTWTKITNGIPQNTFVRVVREDPARKGLLYAGTETGVYVSFDDGANWQRLQLNLPTSPVHDLIVKDNDLVVATHGRSFWILDDITPLHQLTPAVAAEAVHLYKPESTYRWRREGGRESFEHVGDNPPDGALIRYNLSAAPKTGITLEVLDAKGQPVNKFSGNALPSQPGMNLFVWNLRYPPAHTFAGLVLRTRGGIVGPLALPGTYQIRLTVDGQTATAPLELKADPRIAAPMESLVAQFKLHMELRDEISAAHDAINQIREIRRQLTDLQQRIGSDAKFAPISEASRDLDKKMTAVEEALNQTKAKSPKDTLNFPIRLNDKMAFLVTEIAATDAAPTKQAGEMAQMFKARLEEQLSKLNAVFTTDVKALNDLIRKQGIPPIGAAPVGSNIP